MSEITIFQCPVHGDVGRLGTSTATPVPRCPKVIRMVIATDAPTIHHINLRWLHTRFTINNGVAVYFCDPRSPWQRGTIERESSLGPESLAATGASKPPYRCG